MIVFKARSPHELYREQLAALLQQGADVEVKGRPTKELLDVATVIEEPWRRVHIVPGRKANPFLALSESLWLLAGRNDVAALLPYNKRILEFSDDGETLYGAYGCRLWGQIPKLVERLQKDPNDRRAVLSIWRHEDLLARTKDPPCNDMIMFKLRNGLLYMTVFCRSNDIHWGLYAVNLPEFSFLQEYIAAKLGVGLGTQTHISNSLHLYMDGPSATITKRMVVAMDQQLPLLPEPDSLFLFASARYMLHEEFVNHCSDALDSPIVFRLIPFLEFASDFLLCYKQETSPQGCRHASRFQDWVVAGEAFMDVIGKLASEPELLPNDELGVR